MTYYIVDFHADGGQMCIPGRRTFTDPERALSFAHARKSEPGHACGPKSVQEYTSDTYLEEYGDLYPSVALSCPR